MGWEDPQEEDIATLSIILAWRIPWTEEPGRLCPQGCKESDMTEGLSMYIHTPSLLPVFPTLHPLIKHLRKSWTFFSLKSTPEMPLSLLHSYFQMLYSPIILSSNHQPSAKMTSNFFYDFSSPFVMNFFLA